MRPDPAPAPERKAGGVALATAILFLHLIVGDQYVWWQRVLGGVPGMIAVYLCWRYVARRRFDRFPFIEWACLHWYIFLGLPTIMPSRGTLVPVSSEALGRTLIGLDLFVILALIAFALGTRIGKLARPGLTAVLPPLPGRAGDFLFWPWVALTAALNGGLAGRLPGALHYPLSILGSYFPLLAYEALRAYRSGEQINHRRLMTATGILALSGLLTGDLRSVLMPIVTAGALYTVLRRRIPWRAIGVFFLLLVILQPAKLVYRDLAWEDGKKKSGSLGETVDSWWTALTQTWMGEADVGENFGSVATRLDALSASAAAFQLVPKLVPYDRGTTWKYLFLTPVPRALYPGKPNFTELYNDRFNVTFGLQTEEATEKATFVFPILADGYWNFGWGGVAFVGILLGFLLGMYSTSLALDRWGPLSLGLALLADARPHGHLANQVGGLLQTFLGMAMLCWLIWFLALTWHGREAVTVGASGATGATPP